MGWGGVGWNGMGCANGVWKKWGGMEWNGVCEENKLELEKNHCQLKYFAVKQSTLEEPANPRMEWGVRRK